MRGRGGTGRLFSLEGLSWVDPEHAAISAEGAKEVISRASLPVVAGQELDLTIREPHAYDRRDAVARLDGYPVCVKGSGGDVGRTIRVVVDEVTRTCAYAHPVRAG